MIPIKYKKLNESAIDPTKAHDTDAGYDLYLPENSPAITILPHKRCTVDTGIMMEIPIGMEAQIRSKSGLAANYGVAVLNSPGTVDAGFRDSIKVILINHGDEAVILKPGAKVAQMVMSKLVDTVLMHCKSIDTNTDRGTGGLGSTGNNVSTNSDK